MGGEVAGDPLERGPGIAGVSGQDEMADDQAALGQAVLVQDELRLLNIHLPDGGTGVDEVIRGSRISFGRDGGDIFEVRKPDVDDPGQPLDDVDLFVAVRVPDEWKAQSFGIGEPQGAEDGKHEVGRRDEVDVGGAPGLELEHRQGKRGIGHLFALQLPAELIILAEDALEVASGEEDRPRPRPGRGGRAGRIGLSGGAAQDRFLAEVEEGVRDPGFRAALTDPGRGGPAVDAAFPRAENAVRFLRAERFEGPLDPPDLRLWVHRTYSIKFRGTGAPGGSHGSRRMFALGSPLAPRISDANAL